MKNLETILGFIFGFIFSFGEMYICYHYGIKASLVFLAIPVALGVIFYAIKKAGL